MKFAPLTVCIFAFTAISLLRVGNQHDAFSSALIGESLGTMILCSGEPFNSGKCVGSAYCTACKSCQYCAHCNSGGSCGVCGKRPVRTPSAPSRYEYPAPEKHYAPSSRTTTSPSTGNLNSSPNTSDNRVIKQEEPVPIAPATTESIKVYTVSTATSFRQSPDSQATVLKRLAPGHALYLIDCSDRYWCKVTHLGRTGWVKKLLLVEQ